MFVLYTHCGQITFALGLRAMDGSIDYEDLPDDHTGVDWRKVHFGIHSPVDYGPGQRERADLGLSFYFITPTGRSYHKGKDGIIDFQAE